MELMHCPKLGCKYASWCHKFCVFCGTEMVNGPLKPATNTKCPRCKAGDIFPENNFCGSCGFKLPEHNVRLASTDYSIYIPQLSFEDFDQGMDTEQRVYYRWKLKSGDTLRWYTNHQSGIAKVVSYNGKPAEGGGPILTFKKVS